MRFYRIFRLIVVPSRPGLLSGIALAILLLSASGAHGSLSTYWLASGTADWSSPSSWNNGVPTSAANAYVGNNATATLTTAGVCSGAYVGQYGSFYKGTGVLTISGSGSLTTGGIFFIGVVNAGTVNQNAGVVTVNGSYLAVEATGSSYNLGGGLLSVPGTAPMKPSDSMPPARAPSAKPAGPTAPSPSTLGTE